MTTLPTIFLRAKSYQPFTGDDEPDVREYLRSTVVLCSALLQSSRCIAVIGSWAARRRYKACMWGLLMGFLFRITAFRKEVSLRLHSQRKSFENARTNV